MKDVEKPTSNPSPTNIILLYNIMTLKNTSCSFLGVTTKLMLYLIFFSFIFYLIYSLKLFYPLVLLHDTNNYSSSSPFFGRKLESNSANSSETVAKSGSSGGGEITGLQHIVFGIAASSNIWNHRKNYIKLWWEPKKMRGFVWLDKIVKTYNDDLETLPPLMVSNDTSKFRYKNKDGDRSAIRLTRIVSETLRLGLEDVRWIVMGDDDTFFVAENLVRVLKKYDHKQFYYIGANSESHLQDIRFSYNMAYGGGGFAISFPLAKALAKIQDECIERYPELYGSDDRVQACLSELGVPVTKEIGFHQFDLFGNVFGILAAHPVTPLVSLHHLDVIMSIFPNLNQFQSLHLLKQPMELDSAALMQQSICYDKARNWTISVSWGYAVQILRGVILPREMELPVRTFTDWYRKADETAFAFNTRPFHKNTCLRPSVFTLYSADMHGSSSNQTVSRYGKYRNPGYKCKWKMPDPDQIRQVEVYKKPNPFLWNKSPRRNCCRVLHSGKQHILQVDVDECREGEIIGVN
ncbi:OLC1v1000179C1 [Oldenlandia corymbosa var. corymbosa]|uniref:OLC1v1000179C1 n=1 Tax=Oldenlandia corymbosa var. corymbosa TaxID=529605 RepID=A0AAV1D255_OLDCO|nr:OLC1v1000179C1 [Oldenlandia corymbosa var. corymbosa]